MIAIATAVAVGITIVIDNIHVIVIGNIHVIISNLNQLEAYNGEQKDLAHSLFLPISLSACVCLSFYYITYVSVSSALFVRAFLTLSLSPSFFFLNFSLYTTSYLSCFSTC